MHVSKPPRRQGGSVQPAGKGHGVSAGPAAAAVLYLTAPDLQKHHARQSAGVSASEVALSVGLLRQLQYSEWLQNLQQLTPAAACLSPWLLAWLSWVGAW
jgi:hypothetical protein